jgi:hypothetical protein
MPPAGPSPRAIARPRATRALSTSPARPPQPPARRAGLQLHWALAALPRRVGPQEQHLAAMRARAAAAAAASAAAQQAADAGGGDGRQPQVGPAEGGGAAV